MRSPSQAGGWQKSQVGGMTQGLGIVDFSGVLGASKDLGRSPYEICELNLSSLKASKNLEFQE